MTKKKMSRGPFDFVNMFYGTVKPDYSIFTRNQCHVEECVRPIYLDNLCKRHRDLEWYRTQTLALHPVS